MKRLLALAVVSFVALTQPLRAAADFSKFEGTYQGNYSLVGSGMSYPGKLTAVVTPSKNGKAATVVLFGSVTQGGVTIASYGKFTLKSNRKVSSNSVLLGYIALFPASAKYAGQKDTFKFTLSAASVGASVNYTLKFTGKKLVLKGSGTIAGSPLTISLNAKKKK